MRSHRSQDAAHLYIGAQPDAHMTLKLGTDDIPGTVIEEKIDHDAGATTPQSMTRQEIIRLKRDAGHEPSERDTLYRPVQRTETAVTVQI